MAFETGMTRRSFMAGGVLAGVLATSALAGCSSPSSGGSKESEAAKESENQWLSAPGEITEELEADIVIAGAGMSGLACAVQAAHNGAKVILFEKANTAGGNGAGVEGMFAVGSKLQKEAGINIEPVDVIAAEMQRGQYRANGALWMDLIEKSAGNLDWLVEQGVEFDGKVDNYYTGLYNTFHWFKGGHASEGYVGQMLAKAQELGVDVRFSTPVTGLIVEDGAVKGLYASGQKGAVRAQATAVVLSTGGFGSNLDLIAEQGWATEGMILTGAPSSVGDGFNMATAAGAKSFINDSCQLVMNYVQALPTDVTPLYTSPVNGCYGISSGGPVLWVNEEGDRFVNEDVTYADNMMLQSMAMKSNRSNYCIFSQKIWDAFTAEVEGAAAMLDNAVATNEGESLFKVDSLSDLAKCFDIPQEELDATIARYNEICAGGVDIDFGKAANFLVPLDEGPFYIARVDFNYLVGIGGITTNKRREVLDNERNKIPGLYATGVDGVMLYRNVYTINMPGTCCGNNVNSGREAANEACALVAAK